mmetsp:Transcript_59510/g.140209  ORF Transcript_59510/g.140209 Transcript_59510/m.140209 type:complete len:154 (-) Transcript_59510:190-651(-)
MADRSGPIPDGKELSSSLLAQQAAAAAGGGEASTWVPPAYRGADRRDYTSSELQQYDGSTPGASIFVAIKGKIFDVSARPDLYSFDGVYAYLPGKDASRLLAKMKPKLEEGEDPLDLSDLSEKEKTTLDQWEAFFAKKYTFVGNVIQSDVGGC